MHVIGENFIRKSSGLFVPPLIGMVANPLGMFQPCEGDCCLEELLCGPGCSVPIPLQFRAVIAGFQNGDCSNCTAFNDTYILPHVANIDDRLCTYRYAEFVSRCNPGPHFSVVVRIGRLVSPTSPMVINVNIIDGYSGLGLGASAQWQKTDYSIPSDCNTISDLDIPFVNFYENMVDLCAGTPTCKLTAL